MAVLTTNERQQVWRGLMRYWSKLSELIAALTKLDLREAVDTTDTWIEDNQVSFNNALPVAARTNLTASQKTLLFCVVAARRVSIGFARKLLGEVD